MNSTGNISYVQDALGTRLSESYYHISPYAYCANDPINAIDPDGKRIFIDFKCQDIILPMINKLATGTFGISDDGYLYLESLDFGKTMANLFMRQMFPAIDFSK